MVNQVQALLERHFLGSAGELRIGGLAITEIAAEYGTPLFVYDAAVLDRQWALLRGTLPPEFAISYSVKANPQRAVLEHFLAKGSGLEVASGGEFHQALSAGCKPENILFAGPGKSEAELELVLTRGIGEIHAESLTEIERISTIARRLRVCARVAVRVNPSGDAQGGAMRMGGKPAPFGVDEEILDEVVGRLAGDSAIQFRGVHLFAGTQVLDYSIVVAQYLKGLEIARRVATWIKRPLDTLDFGGGLGIPYFPHEQELDMASLGRELSAMMSEVRHDTQFIETRFLVEPGRYLVGEAGVYVARVSDVKISRGKKFLIVDGGMNHHLAASGNLGQTIKRNYPVTLLNKLDEPPAEVVDVVGPLCTPLDVLARDVKLPTASIGDLIGVFQSGAYARSASPMSFLSHPTPPEVWVEAGQHRLIRRRGEYDDYSRDLCLPPYEGVKRAKPCR